MNSEIEKLKYFRDYVLRFYGEQGIYNMHATPEQVMKAIEIVIQRFGRETFDFDSVDRERVRDVMLKEFGLVFPKN